MSSRINSAKAAKTWKTRRPPGGGGVELLVQGGEPDLAGAQVGDHGHQVLEGTAVAVQGGHDQGVAGVEEGVARLQLGALVGAPGLGVGEDAAASGRGERVHLAVQLLLAGGDAGIADADLGEHDRFGRERVRERVHAPDPFRKRLVGVLEHHRFLKGFLKAPGGAQAPPARTFRKRRFVEGPAAPGHRER